MQINAVTIFQSEVNFEMMNKANKQAMDKFKYEVANEMGVNLKEGYNGDLTARENGSVGGMMVKKMIEKYERELAGK